MKIGVFDSGIGGEAIAMSLRAALPEAEVLTANDREHLPYGSRRPSEVIFLTDRAIQPLLTASCDAIVLACNTATTAAIETLRLRYPDQQFIGLEPMVKPAALMTRTGVVTICATPATLSSERYKRLKETYARDIEVYEPDCSTWARMIEDNTINEATIYSIIEASKQRGADVVVLACTHYHWIKQLIIQLAGNSVTVLDPGDAIARRVRGLLT